ncbi:hypothetical protein NMS_0207 [Nonlabens marinus S1-08]|uniref:Uncharacterized protein n=1 Tax=Nonlabens marinus S1-08 TaxID=1454201 RepID=W8VZA1_9FLAO|nr:hypothetical protein NMS_0207 [Nonlabens marinus S1-08]
MILLTSREERRSVFRNQFAFAKANKSRKATLKRWLLSLYDTVKRLKYSSLRFL